MTTKKMSPIQLLLIIVVLGAVALGVNSLYKGKLVEDAKKDANPATSSTRTLVGKTIPEFSFPDIEGLPRYMHEWDGQVVAINFWASWCQPCRREMPMFSNFQDNYREKGLQFIGISLDNREAVKQFVADLGYPISYPLLVGADEGIDLAKDLGNEFGILPYTVFVDRNGKIAFVQYGELSEELTENTIQNLL
ncbi:MAG: TlpA family protein disulfide reductase [Gammaproteobacteria bacterium]